jgi:hypothetical protein
LHFCDIYSIFYQLLKFNEFLEILNQKTISKIDSTEEQCTSHFWHEAQQSRLGPEANMAHGHGAASQHALVHEQLAVTARITPVMAQRLPMSRATRWCSEEVVSTGRARPSR